MFLVFTGIDGRQFLIERYKVVMSAMDRVTTSVEPLQGTLFPLPEGVAVTGLKRTDDDGLTGQPRLRTAVRHQIGFRCSASLEEFVGELWLGQQLQT
jgi:hypothetical protein